MIAGAAVAFGTCLAVAVVSAVRRSVPWDANRLPDTASDEQVLALKPTSPFARFRDALRRDGVEFETAARAETRWARNQPGVLLDLGTLALRKRNRALAEALLVAYTQRTTHAHGAGLAAWLEGAGASDDPFRTFQAVPRDVWPTLGTILVERDPAAAWRFFEPDLRAGVLDPRYAGAVLALARKRGEKGDAEVLEHLAARPDLAPGLGPEIGAYASSLRKGR